MYLFVDTETTGLPRGGVQPRLVSLCWLLAAGHGSQAARGYAVIRPEGFTIPAAATAIHGISQQQAEAEGQPLATVLAAMLADIDRHAPLAVVAHNLAFDAPVLEAEFARAGLPMPFTGLARACTLRVARQRWPGESARLGVVFERLFGEALQGAHHAAHDTEACARIFFALHDGIDPLQEMREAEVLATAILDWAALRSDFDPGFVADLVQRLQQGLCPTAKQLNALRNIASRWRVPLPAPQACIPPPQAHVA